MRPEIVVYRSVRTPVARAVIGRLASEWKIRRALTWEIFLSLLPAARAGILIGDLPDECWGDLRTTRTRLPPLFHVPLAGNPADPGLAGTGTIRIEQSDISRFFAPLVGQALAEHSAGRIRDAILVNRALREYQQLAAGMRELFDLTKAPVSRIHGFAIAVNLSEKELAFQWREAHRKSGVEQPPLRLLHLIALALLLRAVHLRITGSKQASKTEIAVAKKLGISTRTLRRHSIEILGRSFATVDDSSVPAVVMTLEQKVCSVLPGATYVPADG